MENIVFEKKEKIEYIQFKKFLEFKEITHCYTLRTLDNNFRMKDNANLEQSYQNLGQSLNIKRKNIIRPIQNHTGEVKEAHIEDLENTDAVITNIEETTIITSSADCIAMIMYDPIKKVIANVHSGWRGTLKKIAVKTVDKMIVEYGSNPEDIVCGIFPHIRKCHFEVDEDVMMLFKKQGYAKYISKNKTINGKQKYNIDTTNINISNLINVGLKTENILDSGICTVCNKDEFYSYRADGKLIGLNASVIKINSIGDK